MKNRELSNLIYSKLKSTPYLSEKEHWIMKLCGSSNNYNTRKEYL